jgi:hypothetical protein
MKPSETSAGRVWLRGFAEVDRRIAALLLDSLEIHDHVEVMASIGQQIRALAEKGTSEAPILLIPIRSREDLPSLPAGQTKHVAYETFDPGSPLPALPGSEAEVGSMFRGLIDAAPEIFISPETPLNKLRELKPRTICLATDYSGSGKQAMQFAETFRANRTIASWISYGLIKLQVVTYAASIAASNRFRALQNTSFSAAESAKSARSADWSESDRALIEELCIEYAHDGDPNPALGYGDSFGLYLTNMRVPNNLPQILIRAGGTHPGIFPGRLVPRDFILELHTYRPPPSLERTLRNLGAEDLAEAIQDKTRPVKGLRALASLHLLKYGMSEAEVNAMLGMDVAEARKLKSTLIAMGCLTLDSELTKRGLSELQQVFLRGVTRPRYEHVPHPPVGYEPTQLR